MNEVKVDLDSVCRSKRVLDILRLAPVVTDKTTLCRDPWNLGMYGSIFHALDLDLVSLSGESDLRS